MIGHINVLRVLMMYSSDFFLYFVFLTRHKYSGSITYFFDMYMYITAVINLEMQDD